MLGCRAIGTQGIPDSRLDGSDPGVLVIEVIPQRADQDAGRLGRQGLADHLLALGGSPWVTAVAGAAGRADQDDDAISAFKRAAQQGDMAVMQRRELSYQDQAIKTHEAPSWQWLCRSFRHIQSLRSAIGPFKMVGSTHPTEGRAAVIPCCSPPARVAAMGVGADFRVFMQRSRSGVVSTRC